MRALLDTHVLLWAHGEPERLGRQLEFVTDPANDLLFSVASAWEIAIKVGSGRLRLSEAAPRWVPDRVRALGATLVDIGLSHVLAVSALPPIHRDPFDRLLVAQARDLGVPILSADPIIGRYDVEHLAI